jgi:hypothetical protein
MHEHIVAVDIAKRRDYFGILVMKDNPAIIDGNALLESPDRIIHTYDVIHIEKYQGMGFEEMAGRVEQLMGHKDLHYNADLLVDGTGVGEAAVELIRKKGLNPLPVIFTGGENYREVPAFAGELFKGASGSFNRLMIIKEIHVPKKDLAAAGVILMEAKRLRVAPGRWRDEFNKQLTLFKGKVNEKTRRVSYEAETEAVHDDLVVCFLMAAWWALHRGEKETVKERTLARAETELKNWDPFDFI